MNTDTFVLLLILRIFLYDNMDEEFEYYSNNKCSASG